MGEKIDYGWGGGTYSGGHKKPSIKKEFPSRKSKKRKAQAILSGKNCYELKIGGPKGEIYLITASNPLVADEIVVDYLLESRAKNVQRRHIEMDLSKKEV